MGLTEFLGDFYEPKLRRENIPGSVLGVELVMKNGLRAKCIGYRNSKDIDVEYEDGFIAYGVSKYAFIVGIVPYRRHGSSEDSKISLLGLRLQMKCGDWATCVAYRRSYDIDVQFDDGVIVEHKTKYMFINCVITHPKFYADKIGQELVLKSDGRQCTCIEYEGKNRVSIRLESGEVLEGLKSSMLDGWSAIGDLQHGKSAVGLTIVMNCGLSATCIADRGVKGIDVRFEDGTVVTNSYRPLFLRGSLMHPDIRKRDYIFAKYSILGEIRLMNCGKSCTVVADRGCKDIDVQFEDGLIIEHRYREQFRSGEISYPGVHSIVGERRLMTCGYYCEVIEDNGCTDITVRFDDGTVVYNRSRSHFMDCNIAHPVLGSLYSSGDSMCQRLLYYYMKQFYNNVGYSCHLECLVNSHFKYGPGYEIDIMLWDIGVVIEFDGSVAHHFDFEKVKRKRNAIERAPDIKQLFVVRDKDTRIVAIQSTKTVNISLNYTTPDRRYYDVFDAAKIILSDLGNDVSRLEFDASILSRLYVDGISICE